MNKIELAKIIEESLKEKGVKLMDCQGLPTELTHKFSNILFKPDSKDLGDMDPTIPVFVDTEDGIRKAFSITITAP